jgi:RNA polymerase sigma factor (sigma-70 family)
MEHDNESESHPSSSLTVDTSHSMVEAIASGENKEFEKGFRRFCVLYHLPIRKWCGRWFPRQSDADDAAQEILIRLREKLCKYKRQDGVRFRNWLSRVSKHAMLDLRRKAKRARSVQLTDEMPEPTDSDEQFLFGLMIDYERKMLLSAILAQAGAALNDREREIMSGSLTQESNADLALRLGIEVNALHQAQARLRIKLKDSISNILQHRPGLELDDLFQEG